MSIVIKYMNYLKELNAFKYIICKNIISLKIIIIFFLRCKVLVMFKFLIFTACLRN